MKTEKRLIDANEFRAYLEGVRQIYLEEDTFSGNFAAEVIKTVQDEYIATAPTVDAVEVVRCKDCRFYDPQKERCDHTNLDFDVECYDHWLNMKPIDFCSYGERKTDG